MTAVTDAELVEAIKTRLSITGDFHNDLLIAYAEDVKAFMLSAGVSQLVIDSDKSIGVISKGVVDLWNFGAGDGKFSEMFFQRLTQLALIYDDIESGAVAPITPDEIEDCQECLKYPIETAEPYGIAPIEGDEMDECLECVETPIVDIATKGLDVINDDELDKCLNCLEN